MVFRRLLISLCTIVALSTSLTAIAETDTVSVPASAGPLAHPFYGAGLIDSGFVIPDGKSVTVTATGVVYGHFEFTPDGCDELVDGSPRCDESFVVAGTYAPLATEFSLVGVLETEGGFGTPFFVGSGPSVISGPGRLFFAFNDNYHGDNPGVDGGKYTVIIGTDSDGDGFADGFGDCNDADASINPDAPELPGNLVDENCDGNMGACSPCEAWKNHGHFVRCVAHEAEALFVLGDITEDEGDALVTSAAQSSVGKKGFIPDQCQ